MVWPDCCLYLEKPCLSACISGGYRPEEETEEAVIGWQEKLFSQVS